uniref:Reverse transcriptase/retrotransposon-derived protein RNase H-like domain-containing protein n=1 Tax=Peronospora matthiolae TaxID=2874970 RepID=A0AAV1TRH5_9STRA
MREHKLFANLKKCIFAANEIPLLGCIVAKDGVRPDPETIKAIATGMCQLKSRDFDSSLDYLHKYLRNYVKMIANISRLLKKCERWSWSAECQHSFEGIKKSLLQSPVLAIADQDTLFNVVCDASGFAIGCALMQYDSDGVERVVNYQ